MARGFGTTFGSASTDRVQGGTAINLGTTMSMAYWQWENGNGGSGTGTPFAMSGTNFMGSYTSATTYRFGREWTLVVPEWTITKPTTGKWNHIAITYDGGALINVPIFYVNGASVSVTTATSPLGVLATVNEIPRIGNNGSSNQFNWDGMLAEFGLWNSTILTPNEVLSLSQGTLPFNIRNAALTLYCPVNGVAANEPDWSLNHYAMTVTGAKFQPHAPTRIINSLLTGT